MCGVLEKKEKKKKEQDNIYSANFQQGLSPYKEHDGGVGVEGIVVEKWNKARVHMYKLTDVIPLIDDNQGYHGGEEYNTFL